MPDTLAGQTTKLAAWRAAYPFVALHGPGAPGVDTELAGGMPAYARQSSALAPAPAGGLTATDVLTFAVPAGSTVAVVAYWSAATGGTCGGYADVAPAEWFAADGAFEVAAQHIT